MKPSLPRRTLTGSKLPQWVTSWPRGPLKRRFLRKDSAMRILALDLAKNKSVYLDYVTGGERTFGKVATNAPEMEKLLSRCRPDWVVIEACPAAGWVCDLVQRMNIPIQVANANDERWKWKTVKDKSDRKDALKLAQLSEMENLPTVHVPKPAV